MKAQKIRTIIAAVVFVVLSAGLLGYQSFGSLSGFGWDTISILCPLGALSSMIAAKMLIPRAVVSVVIMLVLFFIFGRFFCGWICPVPLLQRIRDFFRTSKKRKAAEQARHDEMVAIAEEEISCKSGCSGCEKSCAAKRAKFDSRHLVLGGSLLSAAIFGFPVFCLICPIGLSFATVLLLWRLFAFGDTTIAAFVVPILLILEVTLLRKWCSRICPLSGLQNLVSRFSRTTLPQIDETKCVETTKGTPCSRCAIVCDADINLRHLDYGEHTLADCTRCRACVDACPSGAISMPIIYKKKRSAKKESAPVQDGERS